MNKNDPPLETRQPLHTSDVVGIGDAGVKACHTPGYASGTMNALFDDVGAPTGLERGSTNCVA